MSYTLPWRARRIPRGDVLGAVGAAPVTAESGRLIGGGRARGAADAPARPADGGTPLRAWLALGAVLALSAGLNLYGLDREGYGNTYYAAAVKSMLTSWHAFFFASFDGGGFVSVDKPPVGLWVQAASAALFGFSGVSLLLPQAVAGVLAVALLYVLVRRAFGPAAGLLAALALAVTPISVVTDHNNTMDAQLVLVLLLAAGAATLAAERGRVRWLLAAAALVGLGFNIKMLQAYPVLPAFWLLYLGFAPRPWRTRLAHLALASAVLLVVSLSWSVAVDLTPADLRPYVGSSGSNSALSLALGYNGLGRVTEALMAWLPFLRLPGLTIDLTQAPGFAPSIGDPGLLRLLRAGVAEQASWLLPLALLGLAVAAWQARRAAGEAAYPLPVGSREAGRASPAPTDGWPFAPPDASPFAPPDASPFASPDASPFAPPDASPFASPDASPSVGPVGPPIVSPDAAPAVAAGLRPDAARASLRRQRVALVLWGGWLAAWAGYFSFARFYHLYYLIMLGPAVAALAGIGTVALWRAYRRGGMAGWLLPTALLASAALQLVIVAESSRWGDWLTLLVALPCLSAVAALVVLRGVTWPRPAAVAATVGVLALLGAPALWSGYSVQAGNGGAWLPQAGPTGGLGFGPVRPGGGLGGLLGAGQPALGGGRPTIGGGRPVFGGLPPAAGGRGGGRQRGGPGRAFGGPAGFGGRGGGGQAMTFAGEQWDSLDPGLVRYLRANQGSAKYLVATPTSSRASLFELATDQPALALGGYQGWDRILTPAHLAGLVRQGTVRFFLIDGSGARAFARSDPQDATADLTAWVRSTCSAVPAERWQSASGDASVTSAFGHALGLLGQQLYDCAGADGGAA